jgi:hypothetical protein
VPPTDSLPDLIEEFGLRRRCWRIDRCAARDLISIQWIYLGAFHDVSSRSGRHSGLEFQFDNHSYRSFYRIGPAFCTAAISASIDRLILNLISVVNKRSGGVSQKKKNGEKNRRSTKLGLLSNEPARASK